jgi:bacillithiol biosynthesis cysteine-adding enzyme BshC
VVWATRKSIRAVHRVRLWRGRGRMYDDREMEPSCLRLSRLPQTTRLFADFLDDFDKVSRFYAYSPDENGLLASARAAQSAGPSVETRREVAEILREENRAFGADESVLQNLDKLAAGAVAVVTGQQAGLFGGPAYTFYKAVTAIHWAEWLTEQGIPAMPVFWLATEDHDFAEVNHVDWPLHDGLTRLEYHPANAGVGEPVGGILSNEEISKLAAGAAANLTGPRATEVGSALVESYRAGETMGSAFGKLLARIFAGRGLILMDPRNAELHRLAAPVFVSAIEQAGPRTDELLARGKALDKAGYHAQVKAAAQSTLLFRTLNGRREAVRRREEEFVAGGKTFSRDEALAALRDSPEEFTANVLLRPVMQDALLPTAAYIGGAAEIAYFAQSIARRECACRRCCRAPGLRWWMRARRGRCENTACNSRTCCAGGSVCARRWSTKFCRKFWRGDFRWARRRCGGC